MPVDLAHINFAASSATLEGCFKRNLINRAWLGRIIGGNSVEADFFPYRIKQDGRAEIGTHRYVPKERSNLFPSGVPSKPVYLVNIPVGFAPNSKSSAKIRSILQRLKDESFAKTEANSRTHVKKKLAVVLGVNQLHSIDPRVNTAFIKSLRKVSPVAGLPHRIEGFFWIPEWEKNALCISKASKMADKSISTIAKSILGAKCIRNEKKVKKDLKKALESKKASSLLECLSKHKNDFTEKELKRLKVSVFLWDHKMKAKKLLKPDGRVYLKRKAFFVLRCIDSKKAEKLRMILEGGAGKGISAPVRSQIPYQKIRQHIKGSPSTQAFATRFSKDTFRSPVYFTTMDSDCESLRHNGSEGYFTLLERAIADEKEKRGFPHIISLGYQLGELALPIACFATRCCMCVREAMNTIIPGSVYMPEPGTSYFFPSGKDLIVNLKKFSFLGKTKDQTFESRRAISNGINNGLFKKKRIVFVNKPALVTQMPARMSKGTTRKYKKLEPRDIKTRNFLGTIKKVSQVHISSLSWAHYVYEGLPDSIKKGAHIYGRLSGVLARIFSVFDPIDGVKTMPGDITFSKKFDQVFAIYQKYTTALIEGERDNKVTKDKQPKLILKKDLSKFDLFLQTRFSILLASKAELVTLGVEDEWVRKIIDAAKASGNALYRELKQAAQV